MNYIKYDERNTQRRRRKRGKNISYIFYETIEKKTPEKQKSSLFDTHKWKSKTKIEIKNNRINYSYHD